MERLSWSMGLGFVSSYVAVNLFFIGTLVLSKKLVIDGHPLHKMMENLRFDQF